MKKARLASGISTERRKLGCHDEQFGSVIATKEQIEFLYVYVRTSGSPSEINSNRGSQSATDFSSRSIPKSLVVVELTRLNFHTL